MTSDVTRDRETVADRNMEADGPDTAPAATARETTYTAPAEPVVRETAPAVVTTAPVESVGPGYAGIGAARDRVRWGPVLAGLLTAIASFVLLGLLAAAIGLSVAQGADTTTAGNTAAIVAAIIGLAAFFIGGYVAAYTAAVANRGDGALNGFLVWALAILLILVLAGVGLGQVFGPTGGALGAYRVAPGGTVDPETIRTSALGAFLGALLPAIAATVGGWLGAREYGARTARYRAERL
jgi:hypothetical protein